MRSGFPDDEETKQYRRLCESVGFRVGQRPVAEVYRQVGDRMESMNELLGLYRKRDVAYEMLKPVARSNWFCAGVLVGVVVVLIEQFIRGSL